MKKLIFIDDNSDILSAQEHQMNELLKKDGNLDVEVESFSCNLSAAPDCLNDMGEIAYPDDPDYEQTNQTLTTVIETICGIIEEDTAEKLELVIDLLLDDQDETLGFKLKNQFLSGEKQDKIIECYRPIVINGPGQVDFNKTLTAFPRFYAQFHTAEDSAYPTINKLLLDQESVPGNTGTHYGNYFGLIYARLYKAEGTT